MNDMFLERTFDPPLGTGDVIDMAKQAGWCFETYSVHWRCSLLSTDGSNMLCWFTAGDAESIRHALRQTGADMQKLWPGTVHEAPESAQANVVVERRFDEPVTLEAIQAVEDEHVWCLDAHDVRFVRTFFSADRRNMICLYAAPDAEAVRAAQREAGMPMDRVWAFQRIGIENLGA